MQSVAAFASLHVSIIFTAALICHFVIPNKWVRWAMWVFFVLTAISTIYFGWHYLLDDVAGLAIGFIAVWIGAKTTGHQMRVQRDRDVAGDGVIGVFPPESSTKADASAEPVVAGVPGPQVRRRAADDDVAEQTTDAKTTGHQMGPQRDRDVSGDGVIGVFPPESSTKAGASAEPVVAGVPGPQLRRAVADDVADETTDAKDPI